MTHPQMIGADPSAYYVLVEPPSNCSDEFCSKEKKCFLTGKGVAYKCVKVCEQGDPLGMESSDISDSALNASSFFSSVFMPKNARLNSPSGELGWMPKENLAGEYLQVDLGREMEVARVATQGRNGFNHWVTSYKITYSSDLESWQVCKENGIDKVFDGNVDSVNAVYRSFPSPILARGIRFVIVTFFSRPAIRVEVYGCK
ncbi:lactadherin isoform X2 [Nematostella vectensis]|nr:lactadherin isoform X2 [Nematostella vectensis]